PGGGVDRDRVAGHDGGRGALWPGRRPRSSGGSGGARARPRPDRSGPRTAERSPPDRRGSGGARARPRPDRSGPRTAERSPPDRRGAGGARARPRPDRSGPRTAERSPPDRRGSGGARARPRPDRSGPRTAERSPPDRRGSGGARGGARVIVTAPRVLERAREIVAPELGRWTNRLSPPLRLVIGYHLGFVRPDGGPASANGGKSVRSALALLSAEAAGSSAETALPGAVAVELVHNFSLLHDDVMDRDRERRHRPTAWTLFGEPSAI